jgi:AcrR family transcriptional regulator
MLDLVSEAIRKGRPGDPKVRNAETSERTQRSDARQSRTALLEAARKLFAERGPEALTVAAVARRAGLNRSTAYQHFRTRDQLVRAVGRAFADEVGAMFREPRRFGEQVDFFAHYFTEHPDIARFWMFQLLSGAGDDPAGWDDYVAALDKLSHSPRGREGIDAEMLGIIGMTSAMVWSLMARQRADGTDGEDEVRQQTSRFARELKRLFLYGALRPEAWPELTADLTQESGQ